MESQEDPSIPRDRKGESKQAEALSRSASQGSIESAISSDEAMKNAIRKNSQQIFGPSKSIKMFTKAWTFLAGGNTWYRKAMLKFFIAILVLSFVLGLEVFGLVDKNDNNLEEFFKVKNMRFKSAESFWQSMIYSNYYYTPAYIVGILDFFVAAALIQVVLSDYDNKKVALLQMEMSQIVQTVPKQLLTTPGSPFREQLILRNTELNKILGSQHFRLKITRLEYLKECLTINYAILLVLFFTKRIVDLVLHNHPKLLAVCTVLEAIMAVFIHFKNIVYVRYRLRERTELRTRRLIAMCMYGSFFLFKASLLFSVWQSLGEWPLFTLCSLAGFLMYRVADKLNDLALINNVRVYVFMILFATK